MLEEWIHDEILEKKDTLKKKFNSNSPFEHVIIHPFLKEEKLKKLQEDIEKLDFYLEDHDLYQFLRTVDFKNIQSKSIQEFRKFIFSDQFVEFISEITSTPLDKVKGTLHSLLLKSTHYLLPHDDKIEKRKIAFILYLCEDFNQKDGGTLDLFSTQDSKPTQVEKSYLPKKNQFIMFKVSSISFHQISEVESSKQRLSISGWFY